MTENEKIKVIKVSKISFKSSYSDILISFDISMYKMDS